MDELKKVLKLTHSLKNQLLVVEKTIGVYSEKLPKHRLTEIGQTATKDAFKLINKIDSILQTNLPVPHSHEDNLSLWLNAFLANQKKWEEDFNLKVLVPKNIKGSHLETKHEVIEFVPFIEQYLGICAISGASAVEISFKINEKLVISIHDNGDGKMNNQDYKIDEIINGLKDHGVNAYIKCVNSLGCGLTCELELS